MHYEADVYFDSWNFKNTENKYLDLSEPLRSAITQNPHKSKYGAGYYDLARPASGNEYVKSHLGLRPQLKGNVIMNYYNSGHIVYVSKDTVKKFKTDAEAFYKIALN